MGLYNVGSGITKRYRHATRLYRLTSKMRLWVLVVLILSNIPTAKVCLFMYWYTFDLENEIYVVSHLRNDLPKIRLCVSIVLMLPAKYSGS